VYGLIVFWSGSMVQRHGSTREPLAVQSRAGRLARALVRLVGLMA
jgi:hypothetical protein